MESSKKKLTDKNIYKNLIEDQQDNFKDKKELFIKDNENQYFDKDEEKNLEELSKIKINKPIELKEFEASPHFKENIIHIEKNCSGPISESSYYCFTCKHSVCEECNLFHHKDHLLIQRDNCINYDATFFNEISKVIEDSFLIEKKREIIKKSIIVSIDNLVEHLNDLKTKKIKETDFIFDKLKDNLTELKKNYSEAKLSIEDYYNRNKTFFNISTLPPNVKREKEEKINCYIDLNNKMLLEDNKIIENRDLENTVFLMNFELMNLCDNKNLQVLDVVNEIKYKISLYIRNIQEKINYISKELDNYFDLNSFLIKFDDYYLDVKLRTKKYNEFITKFKSILNEIIKKNGNLDKLKDFVELFDSKNKKGKDMLFNQEYFTNYNKLNISQKKNDNKQKSRGNSKGKINKNKNSTNSPKALIEKKNNQFSQLNVRCLTYNNIVKNTRDSYKNKGNYLNNYKTIKINQKNKIYAHNSFIKDNKLTNSFHKTYSQIKVNNDNCEDVILNQRIIQRFFAYSIYDLFSKFFKNNNISNKEIEFNSGIASVSFLANYTERYNKLKEIAKPIIGTNQIQYFDSSTNQITKIFINLSKVDHGYSVFPFGCRHIFIDNILYIIGGADNCGSPINIVLSYDLVNNILLRLSNLNDNHAYHSIEYLENFDSIILIGGENNSSCEIMDLDSKRWISLPSLNYPRANVNIYYNCLNCELYALFGMEGEMIEKNKNSDIIEVLKLNDILCGWKKIDYYRSSGLNIKSNYCITLPFTRENLLIYGCSSARAIEKKLFAFFNMVKSECIKVDKDTLELIKLEEKKIKFFDFELSKIQ